MRRESRQVACNDAIENEVLCEPCVYSLTLATLKFLSSEMLERRRFMHMTLNVMKPYYLYERKNLATDHEYLNSVVEAFAKEWVLRLSGLQLASVGGLARLLSG